jgi:hypothetical protein
MQRPWWKSPLLLSLMALLIVGAGITIFSVLAIARALKPPPRVDHALNAEESKTIEDAIALMRTRGLTSEATQATQIERIGLWHAASPTDGYLKRAEQAGDTPFAYTLSSGHHPSAIVLAPRFFTETTPTARAALMIHEMGHYRAYVQTGHSDEYDGYKAEYDTHTKLGMGESDGLTYFSMLDGVVENVAPRLPVYKTYPDVQGYIQQSTNG